LVLYFHLARDEGAENIGRSLDLLARRQERSLMVDLVPTSLEHGLDVMHERSLGFGASAEVREGRVCHEPLRVSSATSFKLS
jgi:hypothetical protein